MKLTDLKYLNGHWYAPTGKHVEAYAMDCFPEFGANEYVDVCTGIRYALVMDELASYAYDKDVHRLIKTNEPGFSIKTRNNKKKRREQRIDKMVGTYFDPNTGIKYGKNRFLRRRMYPNAAQRYCYCEDLPF